MKVIGQGPAVLMLHSSLSSHKQWSMLASQLATDYQLFLPDLAGYGAQPAPFADQSSRYRLEQEAALILAALPAAVKAKPLVLIGHSFGGAVALHLARTGSLQVRQLLLFEPVAFHLLAAATDALSQQLCQEVQQLATQMQAVSPWHAAQLFVDYWQQADYFQHLPLRVQQQMTAQVGKVAADFTALLDEPASLAQYQQISCPVLLLTGAQSRRPALRISELLASIWPQAVCQQLPTGHMGPVSDADLVNPRFLQFLATT
jgi:pimeloyl-ACP methyl ester carboxylesterase